MKLSTQLNLAEKTNFALRHDTNTHTLQHTVLHTDEINSKQYYKNR